MRIDVFMLEYVCVKNKGVQSQGGTFMIKVAVCNQKGGVGKTSVTTNIIGGIDYHFPGKKKLAVDLDPQGHTSYILYKDPNEIKPNETIYNLFQEKQYSGNEIIHRTRNQNVDIVPSNIALFRLQQQEKISNKYFRLQNYLSNFDTAYDIAVIDTPPDLGTFVINALMAADYLVIPTDLEVLSSRGIFDLMRTINQVKIKNEKLKILGILPNKFNKRIKEQNQIMEGLKKRYPELLLDKLAIGTNASLSRAIANRKTIFEFDKKARSYKQFKDFTKWLANQCGLNE